MPAYVCVCVCLFPLTGQAGGAASLLEMKEVPGGSKPLRRWEYYYWGLGATGVAFLLYNRLKKPEKTPEEIAVRSVSCPWVYNPQSDIDEIWWHCPQQLPICQELSSCWQWLLNSCCAIATCARHYITRQAQILQLAVGLSGGVAEQR